MGIRSTVGSMLESTIGRERTNTIRGMERRAASTVVQDCYAEEAQPLPNAEDVLGEVAECAATR